MTKQKKTKKKTEGKDKQATDNEDVRINSAESSLAEFTRRDLPSDKQVEEFEDYIEDEAKDEDIEESLSEIYQDDNGDMVDVRKLERIKRHSWIFRTLFFLVLVAMIGLGGYYAYERFYVQAGSDPMQVNFEVKSRSGVVAGEEFFVDLKYHNTTNIAVNQAEVAAKYPDNFIFLESEPAPVEGKNNIWQLGALGPGHQDRIRIKGKMLGSQGDTGVVLASLDYVPENFSSSFSKESSMTTVINDTGVNFNFDRVSSAYVDEETEVLVRYQATQDNYINDFRLVMDPQENVSFLSADGDYENLADLKEVRPGVWQVREVTDEEKVIPVRFKITEKRSEQQAVTLHFQESEGDSNYYDFYEKKLDFDILKSDLNLALIMNGERDDQGVDLGQRLNYSLVYANRGETVMNDVVLMAVLESDFLDWPTLENPLEGKEKGNTLTWSKQEVPELAELEPGQEGTIDFSLEVMETEEVEPGKDYSVKSYAQYQIGGKGEEDEDGEGESGPEGAATTTAELEPGDNQSNVIVGKINSDLSLKGKALYFNQNNVPVGTGPHPPKVGKETSYKIYWQVTNTLHELKNLEVRTTLPEHVKWNEKAAVSAGNIEYVSESREVVWHIGRLPISVQEANGEFSVSIEPTSKDKNKLMVLLSGATATATDATTEEEISDSIKAKTTKLEDDNIATGDGIVQ